ncbi:MAG: hypothetical protein DRG71_10080 [Deltaproteobacteria bacterium]|nr:MAG: hypothetical protein DRG71_10080 [Deltaproteobacteria bacterium]
MDKDSVCRWIGERGLPSHRVGRHIRFKLSKIDDWVIVEASVKRARKGEEIAQS